MSKLSECNIKTIYDINIIHLSNEYGGMDDSHCDGSEVAAEGD